jgi:hypothetical protein
VLASAIRRVRVGFVEVTTRSCRDDLEAPVEVGAESAFQFQTGEITKSLNSTSSDIYNFNILFFFLSHGLILLREVLLWSSPSGKRPKDGALKSRPSVKIFSRNACEML